MLNVEGENVHKSTTQDKELQAASECWEEGTDASSGKSTPTGCPQPNLLLRIIYMQVMLYELTRLPLYISEHTHINTCNSNLRERGYVFEIK